MACDLEDQLYSVMEKWKNADINKHEAGGCLLATESPNLKKYSMSSSNTADCVSQTLLKDFAKIILPAQA